MSFFSPITARSAAIRWVYFCVYLFLTLGALSMIVPLLITLTSSVAGSYDASKIALFPKFLLSEQELWRRYLDAKYAGRDDMLATAWQQPGEKIASAQRPVHPAGQDAIELWKQFMAERKPDCTEYLVGFTRANTKESAYYNRKFAQWLLKDCGGNVEDVNRALGEFYSSASLIVPPIIDVVGPAPQPGPFLERYAVFCESVPVERKVALNVASYYRQVFLPQQFGYKIGEFNAKFGTSLQNFAEAPFPSTAPEIGREIWWDFVARTLSTRFVELTSAGEEACRASGLKKADFIRVMAAPEHLRVRSLDGEFAEWAGRHGASGATIPQRDLDWQDFSRTKWFWAGQFLTQNYAYVLDGVIFQGVAVRNTLIFIVLSIGGALLVNPLAAYALSRFKLRQTYTILLVLLVTIAFPAEVTLIPNFLILKDLGWLNTFAALVVPGLVNGFSVFLLKGFFDSLPRELYEAAEIDGASEWTIFWGVTMNLSKPILAVISLNAFTSAYGAFMFALIIAPDPSMWTLMVYIYQLRQNVGPGITYASVILTAVPVLIVFLFAQKIILRGIVVPSEK